MATKERPTAGVAGKSTTHLLADYDRLQSRLNPVIRELMVREAHGNCTPDEREAIRTRLDAIKPTGDADGE